MSRPGSLSNLRLAILGLISLEPQSGYGLRKVFTTTPMGHFSSSPGAIYPALKRLEEEGWIRGETEREESLRPRVVYSLTAEGEERLRRELTRPVTREDVIWGLDQLILRFPFLERLGPEVVLRFLREFHAEVESYIPELEAYVETAGEHLPPCARLALEHGIEGYRLEANWARRSIDELTWLYQKGG